jgi:hypothetical protein
MLLWLMLPFGGLWGWSIRLLDFWFLGLPARRFGGLPTALAFPCFVSGLLALPLVVFLWRWPLLALLSVY